jgi:malic enzyme
MALKVINKKISEIRLVVSGAGAAALACLELLVKMGLPRGNIIVTDIKGVVWKGRKEEMDPDKERFRHRHQGAHAGRGHGRRRTCSSAFPRAACSSLRC